MPQGKQQENWVIDNNSCKNKGKGRLKNGDGTVKEILDWVYKQYAYHGFWGNYKAYLNEQEFASVNVPSESLMKVSNVRIYLNERKKAKIDFDWEGAQYRLLSISMTDQNFYGKIKDGDVIFENAYIIISIPKEIDDWVNPGTGQKQAYKFVSKIYGI